MAQKAAQPERPSAVTFKGNPMTLVGLELKVGDSIPEFTVQTADKLETVDWDTLSEHRTKAVLMILVPSIDTSICSLETGKFNRHVAGLPTDKIKTVAISADTPFAQTRWAKHERITNIQMLSDHKDRQFGPAFGVQIKELGLLTRAIYLVDKDGIIRYIQTVPEVASEPDYDAVLAAARSLVGG
ncbi:MAG: thiol peroxidase [Janthinobacterium lividum]